MSERSSFVINKSYSNIDLSYFLFEQDLLMTIDVLLDIS